MKNKIKNIKVKDNVVYVYLDKVTDQDIHDILDIFKNGTLFNELRIKRGIIHTMKYENTKKILEIKTLNKYSKEVVGVIEEILG